MSENSFSAPPTPPNNLVSNLLVPVAIIIGFAMIAGAIYFSGSSNPTQATGTPSAPAADVATTPEVSPVTEADFIRGNPNAPIMIVEYSDYDCPFCKSFHDTMNLIMEDYGITGKVAWVYRQFPLAQLHPNAPRISEAAYCVGELGGDEAFWTFSDLVFDERDTNEPTNMSRLPEFAEAAGVSRADFNTCLSSGRHRTKVEESLRDGVKAGAQGTPYSIIMVGDQRAVINGAQSYPNVKQLIDSIIAQLEGTSPTPPATE